MYFVKVRKIAEYNRLKDELFFIFLIFNLFCNLSDKYQPIILIFTAFIPRGPCSSSKVTLLFSLISSGALLI